MEWLISNTIASLLVPPGSLLLLAVIGALAARRWRRSGRTLIALSLAALYVLSTPFAADALLKALEPAARLAAIPPPRPSR